MYSRDGSRLQEARLSPIVQQRPFAQPRGPSRRAREKERRYNPGKKARCASNGRGHPPASFVHPKIRGGVEPGRLLSLDRPLVVKILESQSVSDHLRSRLDAFKKKMLLRALGRPEALRCVLLRSRLAGRSPCFASLKACLSIRSSPSSSVRPGGVLSLPRVSSFGTVAEVTVKIVFIDHEGSRAIVPGRVGMSIAEVAQLHGIDIGPISMGGAREAKRSDKWTEDLFGEGAQLGFDHVQIPPAWRKTLPEKTPWEQELLELYWDTEDLNDSSRLASQLTLEKAHDGIQVYIPDGIPVDAHM